jgi:hypothetical protein
MVLQRLWKAERGPGLIDEYLKNSIDPDVISGKAINGFIKPHPTAPAVVNGPLPYRLSIFPLQHSLQAKYPLKIFQPEPGQNIRTIAGAKAR